jgi:hypothetical protein
VPWRLVCDELITAPIVGWKRVDLEIHGLDHIHICVHSSMKECQSQSGQRNTPNRMELLLDSSSLCYVPFLQNSRTNLYF